MNILLLRPKPALLATCATMLLTTTAMLAQSNGTVTGTVLDAKGTPITSAAIRITPEGGSSNRTITTDTLGRFSLSALPSGVYTLEFTAKGFAQVTRRITVTSGQSADISVALKIDSVSTEVNVEADATHSIAAALAPMDASLDARSARTTITQHFIQNFTSPVADFGEAVEMAPGTFTTNGNGVGLGQSNTYFRGFPDGNYDIDFDGIPFYDTNTPTHHSWAFFPSQFLGGIDFDRSPGTASTIGPTPFGGSIHLLSKNLSPVSNVRGQVSFGSFNTQLYDGVYDTGSLFHGKFNASIDVHHLQSDGYQTWNHQTRNAGAIKAQYHFNDKNYLTGFSGVIWLDANTPNFNATRCQMYGNGTGDCPTAASAFTGAGLNFLMTDDSDPTNYLDYKYNSYHVPTDFEYVGVHSEFGKNFVLDVKPYTYNYDNGEKYSNAVTITESGSTPCNKQVVKKGVSALPCGVDKYNSYRKYGETSQISQVSNFGIFRAGMWYEWAATNRHQFPSDPLNKWANQLLSNFNEQFWTNSYQPYAEYDFHVTHKFDVTLGTKYAYYTIHTKQFADNGKTIGNLGTGSTPGTGDPNAFITNSGTYSAWLPSIDGNYKLRSNWSVYAQASTGSVVPPSKVFDFTQGPNGTPVRTLPKQQRSTTYQTGTVVKLKNVTFDADFYHTRFQNSYSSTLDSTGEPVYFLQPSSITKGFEAESNIYIAHGVSVYLNATVGRATYVGNLAVSCASGPGCTSSTPQINLSAPSGLWVANTPSDTETEAVTWQHKNFDFGIFNKRVGTLYQDNGAYHNQATINPFSLSNLFFNYTVRNGGRFDQTKIRLSFNNLFDQHNITSDNITGNAKTLNLSANGTTYIDPFNTAGQTPISGGDNIGVLPGRSVMLSITFGLSPKR
jgi:iron complex outermembrane receptor protein